MSLCHRFAYNAAIQVAIWHIEESEAQLSALIPLSFMRAYQSRLQTFRSEKRRKEWLAARVLLHFVFKIQSVVSYSECGKPTIEEGNISLSHSGEYVAVAWAKDVRIGIDIEVTSDKVMRVADKFILAEEKPAFSLERNYAMFLWTAKEAVYKLYSERLHLMTQVQIPPIVLKEEGEMASTVSQIKEPYSLYYKNMGIFFLTMAYAK